MNNLQARYDALEAEKAALNPNNADDRFRQTLIEQEQAAIKDQLDDSDRLQRQAVEVAEIQLPEDYDQLWGPGANAEITGLLRQAKEQLFSIHNDELAKRAESHKAQMDAATAENASLSELVQKLEGELDIAQDQLVAARIEARNAIERLTDTEGKRDNAVRFMEEAQAERDRANGQVASLKRQIDELEGMLRTYKSQSSGGYGGGLKLTSSLTPESKEEALNRILIRRGFDPLPLPKRPEPEVTQEDINRQSDAVEEAASDAERFSAVVQHDAAGSEAAAGAEETSADAGDIPPAATLEARVEDLEQWKKRVCEELQDAFGINVQ